MSNDTKNVQDVKSLLVEKELSDKLKEDEADAKIYNNQLREEEEYYEEEFADELPEEFNEEDDEDGITEDELFNMINNPLPKAVKNKK